MFKQTARIIQKHVKLRMHRQLCQNRCVASPNLKKLHTSSPKGAKYFADLENKFAYDVLRTLPVASHKTELANAESDDDFGKFLDRDWRSASASEIAQAFQTALRHCQSNDVDLSDRRFDKLVDGLMDKVELLTTKELAALLECLGQYPETESFKSHNFHDIWSALDDICNWKMREWDVDTMFAFADLWYKLNLGRICNYVYGVLEKLSKKAERLSKDQLVHAFFLMNVCRRRNIDFEYEHALERKIPDMSADEMAIAAMGFFKSQSKIKLPSILLCMIDKIKEESDVIHDISLTALLKIIRFSSPYNLSQQFFELMEVLCAQIPRLSNQTCLHVALLGTTTQVCHETSLSLVAQKYVEDAADIRLKDLERLLLALSMFDFDPRTTPDVFEATRTELLRPERAAERAKFPWCTCSALTYLSMRNVYVHELMSVLLDATFIDEVFGKSSRQVPRELFLLDRTIEIDCPDYEGNRLAPDKRHKAAKWLTEFVPDHEQVKKISSGDRFFLNVADAVHSVIGGKSYSYIGHVLPHFSKPDVIVCRDERTKRFVKPPGLESYVLGDIMRPCNTGELTWYSVVVVGWHMTAKHTFKPLGMTVLKERQLRKIGYEPVQVLWHEFQPLGPEERVDYILNKMKCL